MMKKIFYAVFSFLLASNWANAQNVSIASTATAPDVSAKLDIIATNKGLLIPRVSLTSLTDASTIATPATSLLIYNTNTTLGVGYYYNTGTTASPSWTKVVTTGNFPGWSLTGNTGTDTAKNFLGTIDNKPLRLRINNIKSGEISLNNIFIGDSVGVGIDRTLSVYNVGLGRKAFLSNDTGSYNVAVGAYAMLSSTSDNESVGIGFGALAYDDDYYGGGNINTAVGSNAMISNEDGYYNTAVGGYSLSYGISGAENTAVGTGADCYDITNDMDVTNSTAIGFNALAETDNEIRLGDDNIQAIGGAVDWSVLSDGRFKRDIKTDNGGLAFIMQLRPVNYHYDFSLMNREKMQTLRVARINSLRQGKNMEAAKTAALLDKIGSKQFKQRTVLAEQKTYNGLIAQEVEAAANKIGYNFSGVVKPTKVNGKYALRYATFVVPLIEAVQQQQQIIDVQNKKIEELLKRVEALENK